MSINKKTTLLSTDDLINSPMSRYYDVIETQGYTSSGDGGGAYWKFTGITGQTPSQSPAQQQHNLM